MLHVVVVSLDTDADPPEMNIMFPTLDVPETAKVLRDAAASLQERADREAVEGVAEGDHEHEP